jgi:prepilin-type N-terminal cleavage/methylation domain-containing protein/prepilin-type processing-associated H-X9-DG protein
MNRANKRGFSLIELLTVVAIIAVLAAILFPVLQAAKEAAQRSSCLANLSQIGQAIAMYRIDNNSTNPSIWANAQNSGGVQDKKSFWFVLDKYMLQKLGQSSRNIVKCPTAPWLAQSFPLDPIFRRMRVGFAYQMNVTGWTEDPAIASQACLTYPLKDSDIKRPTRFIFIAESMGWPAYGVGYGDGSQIDNENVKVDTGQTGPGWISRFPNAYEQIPLNGSTAGTFGGTRCKIYNLRVSHNGGSNFLKYDGHVKTEQTTTGVDWANLSSSGP